MANGCRFKVRRLPPATEVPLGKVELGMKLTCSSCGARFYDLNHTPAVCPKCDAENSRPVIFRTRRASEEREEKKVAVVVAPVAKAPPEDAEAEADTPEKDDDEKEDGVIEDTSDLGGDDVEVVVEKEP